MAGSQDHLRAEQAALDVRYARLDELRAQTADRLTEVRRAGPSGSPQNRSERDAFATLYEDRLAQLDAVEHGLVFGRLDLTDGTTRYIGRIGLTDADHSVLLTDWRAPAAQAFYRATAARPDDVVRRRHLVTRGRRVTGIEDEVLDLAALDTDASLGAGLSGEGALLAALARSRTGRMGDIVATIQAEQDAIIRADLSGTLVVQGGPGTGKTAVALHRAAYLLYAHRRALERSGVLVVGPSPVFLSYIDQVLPSLGETGVVTATIADLVPGIRADGDEPDHVAAIKGRPEMSTVVARAVRARQRVPDEDVPVDVDGVPVVIRRTDVADAITRARRSGRPHNQARVAFVRDMLSRLADQYLAHTGDSLGAEDRAEITEDLRTTREVRIALNLAWMPLTPQRLVEDLFTKPYRLAVAGRELDDEDRAALLREPGAPWTPADVPLLDEAAELLGEDDQAQRAQAAEDERRRSADVEYARQVLRSSGAGGLVSAELLAERFAESGPAGTTAERAAADRAWTYGHVVVDEAQELSPMAWRMLLRRCPTRSMTVVGDLAQTSAPSAAADWATRLDPVLKGSWRAAELTVNYRTPATIADAAQRMAAERGLATSRLTSAREVADAVRVLVADDIASATVRAAADAIGELTDSTDPTASGRVALIASSERLTALGPVVRSALADAVRTTGTLLEAPLVLLSPRAAKGLEFDIVVLVEPEEVARSSLGDLYVAMTRPTRALVVVASATPDFLEAEDDDRP